MCKIALMLNFAKGGKKLDTGHMEHPGKKSIKNIKQTIVLKTQDTWQPYLPGFCPRLGETVTDA